MCDVLSFLRFVFCRDLPCFVWWLVSKSDQLIIFDFFDIYVYVNKKEKRTCVGLRIAHNLFTHPQDSQNLLTRPQ